jgi:hypothetical protein
MHWPQLRKTGTNDSTSVQSEVDEDDDALGLQLLAEGVDPQVK